MKATGQDALNVEMLKADTYFAVKLLQLLFTDILWVRKMIGRKNLL